MASFTVKCLDGIEWKYLPVVVRSTALLSDFIDRVMPMIRPSWKGEDVAMKHVNSGQGLINDLIGFYNKSADEKDIILLRVNGDNTDLYIDRAREVFMRCLFSSANLGPPVYCEFENGLCYQFIHGRTLEYSKLYDPLILQKIAELFALFHTCKLPEQLSVGCQAVAPITFLDSLFPMITDAMCEFPRFKEVFGSKDVLLNEFSYIKRLLDGFSSPVALCHNDLHPGNIIISGENGNCRLWFIDFEFAGPNYTACEIGSFFCEYAGQDLPNYTLCPNMEEQKRFIKTYLELVNKFKGMPESEVSDEAIHEFYIEANQGMLVMHFLWVVWSIVQSILRNEIAGTTAEDSTCQSSTQNTAAATPPTSSSVNHLEYAILRYKQYRKMKEDF